MEIFNFCSKPETVLTNHPTCSGVIPQDQITAYLDLGEDLRPHFGLPIIHDDQRQKSSIQHLHHVLVFQCIGDEFKTDRRFALADKIPAERLQAFVVAR